MIDKIDDTYLTLCGWKAYLFKHQKGNPCVLYNEQLGIVVNEKGVCKFQWHMLEDFILKEVNFSKVKPILLQNAVKFEMNKKITGEHFLVERQEKGSNIKVM